MIKTCDILKQTYSQTKIAILCYILKYQKLTVSKLVELTKASRTNISKQINEMKNISLLQLESIGKYNYYYLSNELHQEQIKMIKSIVNSYHYIDENNKCHVFYE